MAFDGIGENVVGAITDNTAANKRMWQILEQKYPTHFFHGCISHGLHLLVNDIFGAKKRNQLMVEYFNSLMVTHLKSCSYFLMTVRK